MNRFAPRVLDWKGLREGLCPDRPWDPEGSFFDPGSGGGPWLVRGWRERVDAQKMPVTKLMEAAERGDLQAVRENLGEAGNQDKYGCTALMWAVWNGKLECAKLLLSEAGMKTTRNGKVTLNGTTFYFNSGTTALMVAAEKGYAEFIPLLGKEIGVQNNDGLTALMVAICNDRTDCARLLLSEAGKQTTRKWDDFLPGTTALMLAAYWNHPEVVQILLPYEQGLTDSKGHTAKWYANNGAPWIGDYTQVRELLKDEGTERISPPKEELLLMMSAAAGDVEGVRKHLDHAGYQDPAGTTALMMAARYGRSECIPLLEKEIGMQNHGGRTALMYAAFYGNLECVELLLSEIGVRTTRRCMIFSNGVTLTFGSGATALMMAARQGHANLIPLLEIEIGMQNNWGWTALMNAASESRTNCVLLLERELGKQKYDGVTALMLAACNGNIDCVRLLLSEAGKQLTKRWNGFPSGTTALMIAARNDHPEVVELLLPHEQGKKNNGGTTALMLATKRGYDNLIPMLENEARLQNKNGLTALMLAASRWNSTSVRLLAPLERGVFNNRKETALLISLQEGNVDYARLLADEAAIWEENGKLHIERIRRLVREEGADSILAETYRAVENDLEVAVMRQAQKRLEMLAPHHITPLLPPIDRLFDEMEVQELGEAVWSMLFGEHGAFEELDDILCEVEDKMADGCAVCLSHPKDAVLLPCRHLVICKDCADQIEHCCPYCRTNVDEALVLECPEGLDQ